MFSVIRDLLVVFTEPPRSANTRTSQPVVQLLVLACFRFGIASLAVASRRCIGSAPVQRLFLPPKLGVQNRLTDGLDQLGPWTHLDSIGP